jgi:glutamyl-tRNA reductase
MSELLVVGASHKTASLKLREKLAISPARVPGFLIELGELPEVHEAVALSTCNRTELYIVGCPDGAESAVVETLCDHAGVESDELLEGIYSFRNCDAAKHLYRVASGLDSMVPGESEVQGQVKRAYEIALGADATGPLTNRLFRAGLETGKRVRTETRIACGGASVASVAVDLAQKVIGDLAERHVLIIGAGELAELTAQSLSNRGLSSIFVANRHRDRAIALAEQFGGEVASFESLTQELIRADIVISSTSSPHTIVSAEELSFVMESRRGRPLLMIDLGVPRNLDSACGELSGVTLWDLDSLQARVESTLEIRRTEAKQAEEIIEEEIYAFAGWLGSLEVTPTIAALRTRTDAIVKHVLAENASKWDGLSPRDSERVEAVARAIANRLMHSPTRRVKELGVDHRHARLQLLRELFELDDADGEQEKAIAVEESSLASVSVLRPVRPVKEGKRLVGSADKIALDEDSTQTLTNG